MSIIVQRICIRLWQCGVDVKIEVKCCRPRYIVNLNQNAWNSKLVD